MSCLVAREGAHGWSTSTEDVSARAGMTSSGRRKTREFTANALL